MKESVVAVLLVIAIALTFATGLRAGYTEGRQSVVSVACEPAVVGLRRNGTEIPLTSAQRDSLARAR